MKERRDREDKQWRGGTASLSTVCMLVSTRLDFVFCNILNSVERYSAKEYNAVINESTCIHHTVLLRVQTALRYKAFKCGK